MNVPFNLETGKHRAKPRHKLLFDAGWRFMKGDHPGAWLPGHHEDDGNWKPVDLPHDWSIEEEFTRDYPGFRGRWNRRADKGAAVGYLPGGVGWYRKHFDSAILGDEAAEKDVFVEFDGVYMDSRTWINGTYLGHRPYGYINFRHEIGRRLKYSSKDGDAGNNVIAVRVENKQPNSRWYSGSGIYRHTWLVIKPKTGIAWDGTRAWCEELSPSRARIGLDVELENKERKRYDVVVITEIIDADGIIHEKIKTPAKLAARSSRAIHQEIIVDGPEVWSIDNPIMYMLVTRVESSGDLIDEYSTPLGIRTLKFDPNLGFFLNDVPTKIKGACMHHDLGCIGSAFHEDAARRQVRILKEMGVNAIRTSHNPPAAEFLHICDEEGMLVLEEAFDEWLIGYNAHDYHRHFLRWHERDLRAMLRRDRNHPSVIAWSIGNEIAEQHVPLLGRWLARRLVKICHQEDPSRPVTSACNAIIAANRTGFASELDVVGYNYFGNAPEGDGRYDIDHAFYPERIILATETCAAMRSRDVYHLPADQYHYQSPDMQCSSYDNCWARWPGARSAEASWKAVRDRDFVAGEFIWTGFDYLGEPTPYKWPARSSYFGAVDLCGFPKDIYYFYRSQWSNKDTIHLLPHWNWKPGQVIPVYCYTNCEEVELFLNGKSLGRKDFSSTNRLFLQWKVEFEPGELVALGSRDGRVVKATRRTAGIPSKVLLFPEKTFMKANGHDLAFVQFAITDDDGTVVPGASDEVYFKLEGDARIEGVASGNPLSHEPFKADHRRAFNGRGICVLRAGNSPSRIILIATAPGLSPGSTCLETRE